MKQTIKLCHITETDVNKGSIRQQRMTSQFKQKAAYEQKQDVRM